MYLVKVPQKRVQIASEKVCGPSTVGDEPKNLWASRHRPPHKPARDPQVCFCDRLRVEQYSQISNHCLMVHTSMCKQSNIQVREVYILTASEERR